jgi:hypothetical protein
MPQNILKADETRLLTVHDETIAAAHADPLLQLPLREVDYRLRVVAMMRELYADLRTDKRRVRVSAGRLDADGAAPHP